MGWSTFSCATVNWPFLWGYPFSEQFLIHPSFIFHLPNAELGQEELSASLRSQEEKHKTITLRELGDENDKNEPQAVSSTNFGTTLLIKPFFFFSFLTFLNLAWPLLLATANTIVFSIVQKLFESRMEGSEHLFPFQYLSPTHSVWEGLNVPGKWYVVQQRSVALETGSSGLWHLLLNSLRLSEPQFTHLWNVVKIPQCCL